MSFPVTYQGTVYNVEERRLDLTLANDNSLSNGVVIGALPTMQGEIQRIAPITQTRAVEIINGVGNGVTPAQFQAIALALIQEGLRDAYDDTRTGWTP